MRRAALRALALRALAIGSLAIGSLTLAACCRIPVDLETGDDGRDVPPPPAASGEVHLGDAEHPSPNDAVPVLHPWWVPGLEPKRYRLGYRVPDATAAELRAAFHRYARSVGHRRVDKTRFQWKPSPRCNGGLHCVYDELIEEGREAVAPLVALFDKRVREAPLSSLEAAELVVTFVQEVTYRVPDEEPFGILPPPLVVRNRLGDCDSKSLLAHMLLGELGIDSVLISSEVHKHTMLGVALPAPGTSFEHEGRRYAFVETTAKRSPIGHINPQLLRPSDWRVVAMRYGPAGRGGGERVAPPRRAGDLLSGALGGR
jgi:hypothetical protein